MCLRRCGETRWVVRLGCAADARSTARANRWATLHRVITRHLLDQAGLKADEADSGAVTLIQRFGSAANLNIHLHCLVLDGVYRRSADGTPAFVEASAPTDQALQAVLHKIITRTMKMLTRRGVLVEEEGST